jgi:hypothetical protein
MSPEATNYKAAYPYGWRLNHGAGPCARFFGGQTGGSVPITWPGRAAGGAA